MWTERPRALTDGLLLATAFGLALSMIVNIGHEPDEQSVTSLPQCQEVVVLVHQGEEILAQCPQGSWLDIVDNNVVCRCGSHREPLWFEHEQPKTHILPPTPRNTPTDPPRFPGDKRGIPI
jgi:hypothetical protein